MIQSTLHLPSHLAVIMDGNGRWAEQRGQRRSVGHLAGARAMREVVAHCATVGIAELTLYAFSRDNWRRPATEVRCWRCSRHTFARRRRPSRARESGSR